jgi:sulfide:quinone oxidoreductase
VRWPEDLAEYMARRVMILGGGTGGTLVANRLRRMFPVEELAVTVVDEDDRHIYQPGLLLVPFGLVPPVRLQRPRSRQLRRGIEFRQSTVELVDVEAAEVHLENSTVVPYDVLVVASGARLATGETEGLTGPGWMKDVFTFYDLEGASSLAAAIGSFEGGRVVIDTVDLPIKCPVAPLEFCFLADWYFRKKGIRDRVELTFVTPLDGAFTKPVASKVLSSLLDEKGVHLVTEFNTGEVDGRGRRLIGYDEREVPFDLAVVVPLHSGADYVGRSVGLGDGLGFVTCDEGTLQSKAAPNIFVVGDAGDVPTSKAGSVAHFEGQVVAENIRRFLLEQPFGRRFDGHTNCFVETGFGKALLVDFNYDTEPLPGRYPGKVGLPLLEESRLNHFAKLAFEHFYWHVVLPGREVPGIGSAMPAAGKRPAPAVGERRY